MRRWLFATLLCLPSFAPAQDLPQEISELRRRVAAIRGNMADITEAAEYAVRQMNSDSSFRFVTPMSLNTPFYRELFFHGGGPPETGNADIPNLPGVAILSVRSWSMAFGVAMLVDRMHSNR